MDLPYLISRYKIPIIAGILLIFFAGVLYFWTSKNVYFQDGQLKTGQVIARVKGVAITEEDFVKFDKIYNAVVRYQQKNGPKVKVPSREETIEAIKEATVISIEAENKSISVSEKEIKSRLKSFNPAVYGLSSKEFTELIKMQILRQKLTDVLVGWREFGFVAIRFDLMARNIDLSALKPKAQNILEKKKTVFNRGRSAASIAKEIRRDSSFIAVFSTSKLAVSPVQFKEPPKKGLGKIEGKTFAKSNQSLDKYVLNLTAPTVKVWCPDAACYLIKVTAGNEGIYPSLQEWLDKELGK